MTELVSGPLSNWPASSGAVTPTPTTATAAIIAPEAEGDQRQARWAEWLAKGGKRDAAMQSRIMFIASLLCLGLAAWMSFGL